MHCDDIALSSVSLFISVDSTDELLIAALPAELVVITEVEMCLISQHKYSQDMLDLNGNLIFISAEKPVCIIQALN